MTDWILTKQVYQLLDSKTEMYAGCVGVAPGDSLWSNISLQLSAVDAARIINLYTTLTG